MTFLPFVTRLGWAMNKVKDTRDSHRENHRRIHRDRLKRKKRVAILSTA